MNAAPRALTWTMLPRTRRDLRNCDLADWISRSVSNMEHAGRYRAVGAYLASPARDPHGGHVYRDAIWIGISG